MSTQPLPFDREAFLIQRGAQQAKAESNRRNAQQSTGPRTPEGKAISSKNRLAHGLCSSALLVGDESPDEFEALQTEFLAAYQPATPEERMLTDQLVEAQWRLNRARRVEAKAQDLLVHQSFEILGSAGESLPFASDHLHVASFLLENNEAIYRNMLRYVAAIERSHQRALKNLHHAQEKRRALPPPPAESKPKAVAATQPLPEIGFEPPSAPTAPSQTPGYVNRS